MSYQNYNLFPTPLFLDASTAAVEYVSNNGNGRAVYNAAKQHKELIDVIVKKRCISSALAMELRLSFTNS